MTTTPGLLLATEDRMFISAKETYRIVGKESETIKSTTAKPLTILVFTLISLLAGCTKPHIETGIKPTLEQTLDAYLEANVTESGPGTAILVLKDGEVAYKKGRGSANIDAGISITPGTGFRIASVSKTFTAIAVMQLVESNRILLNESILTYLPELPAPWRHITVHHLLSHQSGIPDYLNDIGIEPWPDVVRNSDLVSYFLQNNALEFRPGSSSHYSNTGYVLLSEIVSQVSGMAFSDYVRRYIFQPTDMNNSYILDDNSKRNSDASLNDGKTETIFGKYWHTTGEDGQVSSIEDFQLFINALFRWELISEESFNLMTKSHSLDFAPGVNYGYGLGINSDNPPKWFFHEGTMGEFKSTLRLGNTENIQLVILSNGNVTDHNYIMYLVDNS